MSKGHHSKCKSRHGSYDATHSTGVVNCGVRSHTGLPSSYTGPKAHKCLLFYCVWDTDWILDSFLWSVLVWHGTNSSVSAGSGRVPGTNWLFEVSSFTWGAGHWPADISHPDRKWSERNRDHVRDIKCPRLKRWTHHNHAWDSETFFLLCRLFGPKRKMTSAIARWHSSARPPSDALEQAYADQLEAKMQEMAIQLHKVTTILPTDSHANINNSCYKEIVYS